MTTRRRFMQMLAAIRHRIAHWLHWNYGTVETWWEGSDPANPGRLMVGFRCTGCKELMDVAPVPRFCGESRDLKPTVGTRK